jgi:hypothetical protein
MLFRRGVNARIQAVIRPAILLIPTFSAIAAVAGGTDRHGGRCVRDTALMNELELRLLYAGNPHPRRPCYGRMDSETAIRQPDRAAQRSAEGADCCLEHGDEADAIRAPRRSHQRVSDLRARR